MSCKPLLRLEDLPVWPVTVMRMVTHADAIGCYRENNSLSSLLGAMAMASYYKHSGKFAPQGPILGLLGGIVFSVPTAILYDFALFTVTEMKLRIEIGRAHV